MPYSNTNIESSYRENDIGRTLYDFIMVHEPLRIVEIGVLNGYSTVAIAQALRDLEKGHLTAYDLFEDYEFKHSTQNDVESTLAKHGVARYVTLKKGDLNEWLKNPEPFDLLHVDVSNTGETLEQLYDALEPNIKAGALVIFEGGTLQRDNVEWMKKFNKKPMRHTQINYKVLNYNFPGLSQMLITHKIQDDMEKTNK